MSESVDKTRTTVSVGEAEIDGLVSEGGWGLGCGGGGGGEPPLCPSVPVMSAGQYYGGLPKC